MDGYLKLLAPVGVAFFCAITLLIFRGVAFGVLHKWARRTETKIDDIIVGALKTPSKYWAVAMGIYAGIITSEMPEKYSFFFTKIFYVLMTLSVTVAAANAAGKLFKNYMQRHKELVPATGLANGIVQGVIYAVGILVAMSSVGISITPLVTALGVGGLAVALALQDTLANFFAGVHILMERSVRVGDFIRLESGQEGYVHDITWRTTRVRMLPNNMVVIPNSKLSQSVVINYSMPEKRMSLLIPVSVSYSSRPEKVEDVLVDVAMKAVNEIPGLLAEPAPFVRFIPGFGESSLDFTLICQVKEFVDQYFVQHELRKKIFNRFVEEGIEIPFPHRTVYLRKEP